MTGVVTGHLGLRHLRLVVISVLLTVPLRADVVTSLTFREEGVTPRNISTSQRLKPLSSLCYESYMG